MKTATIIILDEINVKLSGISSDDLKLIISKVAVMTPNGRHTAAYKIGAWDGKEAQLNTDGGTFVFMLDKIIPMLGVLGYEFDLIDNRVSPELSTCPIDKDYLSYAGIELRHYQVDAVNIAIKNRIGLIDFATAAGKTLICAALCKKYDDIGSLTIVPSVLLVNQTFADYKKIGLDISVFGGKVREIKTKHIISTWQTLARNPKVFATFKGIFLFDEAHIMGDSMYSLMSNELRHSPVRIGFSGTIPTNKWKREKLNCHIGGNVLAKIMPDQLIKEEFISPLKIKIVPVKHTINLPNHDWESELAYLNKNPVRVDAISVYIKSLPLVKKRLILVHPEFGETLVKILGLDFIRDETPQKERKKFLEKFVTEEKYSLCASYGTTATGISIDEIEQLILVEVGKNRTRVVQSIGRGLRLDKNNKGKELDVIDIYTELYSDSEQKRSFGFSGTPHLIERLKIYKEYKYGYTFGEPVILT